MAGAARTLHLVVAFVFAFLTSGWVSQYLIFTVYMNALKVQFQISQVNVDVMQGLYCFGLASAPFAGIMSRRYGAAKTGFIFTFVCSCFHLLLWSTTYFKDFYSRNHWLMMIYFFGAGTGYASNYVVTSTCLLQLFGDALWTPVYTLYSIGTDIGPLMCIAIYNQFFYGDGTGAGQDFRGYMLFFTVSYFIILTLNFLLFSFGTDSSYSHSPCDETAESEAPQPTMAYPERYADIECQNVMKNEESPVSTKEKALLVAKRESPPSSRTPICKKTDVTDLSDTTPTKLWRQMNFHLLIWPLAIGLALRVMACGNLDAYLMSFHLDAYRATLPYAYPSTSCTIKLLLTAWLFWGPGTGLEIIMSGGCLLNALGLLWALSPPTHFSALTLIVMLWAVSGSLSTSLGPVFIKAEFDIALFSVCVGWQYGGYAAFSLLFQYMFGAFHDLYIAEGMTDCYGYTCYLPTFIISSVILILCAIALMIYRVRKKNRK